MDILIYSFIFISLSVAYVLYRVANPCNTCVAPSPSEYESPSQTVARHFRPKEFTPAPTSRPSFTPPPANPKPSYHPDSQSSIDPADIILAAGIVTAFTSDQTSYTPEPSKPSSSPTSSSSSFSYDDSHYSSSSSYSSCSDSSSSSCGD